MTRWLTIAIRGAAIFLLARGMASAQPAAFTIGPQRNSDYRPPVTSMHEPVV